MDRRLHSVPHLPSFRPPCQDPWPPRPVPALCQAMHPPRVAPCSQAASDVSLACTSCSKGPATAFALPPPSTMNWTTGVCSLGPSRLALLTSGRSSPTCPIWTGAHDASGRGMGGVFSGPDGTPICGAIPGPQARPPISFPRQTHAAIYPSTTLSSQATLPNSGSPCPRWYPWQPSSAAPATPRPSGGSARAAPTPPQSPAPYSACAPGTFGNTKSPPLSPSSRARTINSLTPHPAAGTSRTHSFVPSFIAPSHRPHPGKCYT
jgi:hypothetical protein